MSSGSVEMALTVADVEAARARIADVVRETPVFGSETFSRMAGREVLLKASARHVSESPGGAPFRLRAGLLVEMLGFYDELRRRDVSVPRSGVRATSASGARRAQRIAHAAHGTNQEREPAPSGLCRVKKLDTILIHPARPLPCAKAQRPTLTH